MSTKKSNKSREKCDETPKKGKPSSSHQKLPPKPPPNLETPYKKNASAISDHFDSSSNDNDISGSSKKSKKRKRYVFQIQIKIPFVFYIQLFCFCCCRVCIEDKIDKVLEWKLNQAADRNNLNEHFVRQLLRVRKRVIITFVST